jgi:SAM-dependent methyltransferase
MSIAPAPYALFGGLSEQERLIAQALSLETYARVLLDRISVKPGSRVVDVGCGPIGIMNILSERVGSAGFVVGIERDPRFAAMARAELKKRSLRNVEVVNADAFENELSKNSYDLIHERLVLMNLPAIWQNKLITEMSSLLKPGGTIALQEFDSASYACHPEHPSWSVLLSLWNTVFHATGGNEFVGRSLGSLLRRAGVQNIEVRVQVEAVPVGEYRRTHLLSLLKSMREPVLASGLISTSELSAHMAALSRHLADPETTLIDKLMVQAWGIKPSVR